MTRTAEASAPKRRRWRGIVLRLGLLFGLIGGAVAWMVVMPGSTHQGAMPRLNQEQTLLMANLREHVRLLALEIGDRGLSQPLALETAARNIERIFASYADTVLTQSFPVNKQQARNIEIEWQGSTLPDEIVIVGAHYDSVEGCPGADDNASGCAALFELARLLHGQTFSRTLRFVAFVNEEPPYFESPHMGSRVYADRCQERGEQVVAMLSLETLGYYDPKPGSQQYPPPFGWLYPDTGDFIAFVADLGSRSLLRQVVGSFREAAAFPSEGVAAPGWIAGINWSDHASFSRVGYSAVMVTDTAPFRNPHYHQVSDLPATLDYARFARVVAGLRDVVRGLAGGE